MYSSNERVLREILHLKNCSVVWSCRIHRLLLCRVIRSFLNECPGYDTKQSDGEVLVILQLCGIRSTPSLPSLAGSLRHGVVESDAVQSMGEIEQNCVIMQKGIAWNRTVLTFKLLTSLKLRTNAKWNYLKWNCFCMLNWIVWNGSVFDIETVLTVNWILWNRTVSTFD